MVSYKGRQPRPKGADGPAIHHRRVNSRKDKVSKAAALTSLALALGLLAPPPDHDSQPLVGGITPGRLAYAEPPRLERSCAEARRELRFEMIEDDAPATLPPGRRPAVCLAVHSLSGEPAR